ncbi:Hint domain-containing protein [Celeribacter marinus]|uniref:Hint domain-containing protein n=1 Tax=Celeribacter marinus TaxID=1397108 RepID=UPI003F6CB8D2
MTASTTNVFFIGTLPILDTDQGNGVMEQSATLLRSYMVGTDAVYHNLHVHHDPQVVDGLLATNDYGASTTAPDGLYDEGFTNTVSGGFSELDSQQLFFADVTYRDIDGTIKTMSDVPFNVYQLENGDTYMVPTGEIASLASGVGDAGQESASKLSGRDILEVELTTVRTDAIGNDNLIYDWESVQDEVQTFYLGNQSILDTTQGDGTMEGAANLLGDYNGVASNPAEGEFSLHTLWTHHDPSVNDGLLATNDYGASSSNPDGLYDEGFGNTPTGGQNGSSFSEIDSQQLFYGDVTYLDANGNEQVLSDVALNVYQLENGDVFAVPTREITSADGTVPDANDVSPSVLAGLEITSISLTSLRDDGIGHDNLMYDSESIGDGASLASLGVVRDGVVNGTEGADVLTPGYTDAQGDEIDGSDGFNDVIHAGAGDDTVFGGLGADTILGEAGDDLFFVQDGFGVGVETVNAGVSEPSVISTDGEGHQTAPIITQLDNGNLLYVWGNNAFGDTAENTVEGRIFDPAGNAISDQFQIGTMPYDGSGGAFEVTDGLTVELLADGNVAVGYAANYTTASAPHEPVMTILDGDLLPGDAGFVVAQDVIIQSSDTTTFESAPILTALDDGRLLAVYTKDTGGSNQELTGRIFEADGTPATDDFAIGSLGVDGTMWGDSERNIYVEQLAGGNVVVGIAKEDADSTTGVDNTAHQPVINIIDPSLDPSDPGFAVLEDEPVRTADNDGAYESAPRIVPLDDGGFMTVWYDYAEVDSSSARSVLGRIYDEDGTPSGDQFDIGTTAIDGYIGYNVPIVDALVLPNGNVAIGWVRSTSDATGNDDPVMTIIDPSIPAGQPGHVVLADTQINQEPGHTWSGPPQFVELANGNFVAVWHDGAGTTDNAIYYRAFDQNGTALGDEVMITSTTGTLMDSGSGAQWDSIDVAATGPNTFSIGWMGNDANSLDGDGTSVLVSNVTIPLSTLGLDPITFIQDSVIIGGETDESTGDTLDLSLLSEAVDVVYTGDEAGTVEDGVGTLRFEEIENLVATDFDDLVDASGAVSGVNVDTGAGDDSILGGAGDDTLTAGEGADTIDGGAGDDVIVLGDDGDSDVIVLADGDGSDTITGLDAPVDNGDGTFTPVDTLDVSGLTDADGNPVNTADVVVTDTNGDGTGDPILTFPNGESVTLVGVDPTPFLDPSTQDDALVALGIPTAPDGIVEGTSGDDLIDIDYTGDPGGDMVDANDATNGVGVPGSNDDSIDAGDGNDTVLAGDGDDTILGGGGDDSIFGGQGNDVLDGGAGQDVLTGGPGNDTFVTSAGHDTITDFGDDLGDPDDGDDGNNDFIDLSDFYNQASYDEAVAQGDIDPAVISNPLEWLRADLGDDGVLNDTAAGWSATDTLTLQNGGSTVDASNLTLETTNVICFASGTLIKTINGEIPVEELSVGTRVLTMDASFEPMRWIGSRHLTQSELAENPHLRPIRISAGSLGVNMPEHDLVVSPQHRILINSIVAERMFGEREVLVAAKQLLDHPGVEVDETATEVTYWHFLFENHQIVFSNGMPAESLFTGPEALRSISPAAREEISELFPHIVEVDSEVLPRSARRIVKGRSVSKLVARVVQNRKDIFETVC